MSVRMSVIRILLLTHLISKINLEICQNEAQSCYEVAKVLAIIDSNVCKCTIFGKILSKKKSDVRLESC